MASATSTPLRVVTFNVLPLAYALVNRWAQETGNKLVLLVTTPGPTTHRSTSYQQIINAAPPEQEILVTTRLRSVALPLIQKLEPDLIVSFTFPYRIPPEIRSLARYGAVNLHPTPLPAYRGPNPMRSFYDGYPTIGATMHWTADDFDTGLVLSQYTAPLPNPVTVPNIIAAWQPLLGKTFYEGMARAIAGDPGTPQDESQASYAAQFTEAEQWLDLSEASHVIQRKLTALTMAHPNSVKVRIAESGYSVEQLDVLDLPSTGAPGSVAEQSATSCVVNSGDGQVRISLKPIAAN